MSKKVYKGFGTDMVSSKSNTTLAWYVPIFVPYKDMAWLYTERIPGQQHIICKDFSLLCTYNVSFRH